MSGSSLIDLLASAIHGGFEPEKLFELYLPGFKSLRNVFAKWFRVDLTKFMTSGFFFLLYMSAGRTMFHQAYEHLLGYFTSTVSIPPDDRLNREVLTWISDHIAKRNTRFLAVQSVAAGVKTPYGSDYISKTDKDALRSALNEPGMLNSRTTPMHYYPALGKVYFIFQHRPFIFDLLPGRYVSLEDYNSVPTGEEPILIRCFGRSPEPLKRFLEHCRTHSINSKQFMTTIYTTEIERYGERLQWREANTRPVRPLNTIDLAEGIKHDILQDIERYIHPSTQLFYARRGIPYRRGFLFYGPPGTGKTSFSLALAGHFEIDLYIVSLASKNLDDDGLTHLFNELPPRCIVLLEDIDSAGIDREIQNPGNSLDSEKEKQRKKFTISLSGLLNTIDGAASHEGRILIMTSNTPETLDAALIRHGRIDKQIEFGLISKFDAKQLFMRMFSLHEDEQVENNRTVDEGKETPLEMTPLSSESLKTNVQVFAEEFASKIPERRLSPAEIQGFLLDHRDDIREAVAKVSDWAAGILAARVKKIEEIEVNSAAVIETTS
jgi:chaperone BCS1